MRALQQLIGCRYPKNIDEIIKESIKLRYPFQHFATVIISQGDIIKGITQSKPNNLILDNFGILFAEMFTTPSQNQDEVILTDVLNAPTAVQFYGDNTAGDSAFPTNVGGNIGTKMQVGSGITPAARADFAIETPFIVAPEDDLFDTGPGAYAAGAIGVTGVIVAGGAGTINEIILVMDLTTAPAGISDIAFFHDLLAIGEAFVLGDTITVTYTINL